MVRAETREPGVGYRCPLCGELQWYSSDGLILRGPLNDEAEPTPILVEAAVHGPRGWTCMRCGYDVTPESSLDNLLRSL